jgi:hypothetical protein
MENKKMIYVRPEDLCDLILDNLHRWNTRDIIKEKVSKIKGYLKKERFDKLESEFGLAEKVQNNK